MTSNRAVEKEELRSKDKLESFIMKENYLVQYVTIHPQPYFRICLWEFPALMLNNSVTSFQVNANKLLSAFVRRQSYACEAGPFSSNQKGWGAVVSSGINPSWITKVKFSLLVYLYYLNCLVSPYFDTNIFQNSPGIQVIPQYQGRKERKDVK